MRKGSFDWSSGLSAIFRANWTRWSGVRILVQTQKWNEDAKRDLGQKSHNSQPNQDTILSWTKEREHLQNEFYVLQNLFLKVAIPLRWI